MLNCDIEKEKDRLVKGIAVICVLVVLILSIGIVTWILLSETGRSQSERTRERLDSLASNVGTGKFGKSPDSILSTCTSDEGVLNYTKTTVREKILSQRKNGPEAAVGAFYKTSRFIVHWMVMGSASAEQDAEGWKYVRSCERHRSTYTVSSGPKGCYKNGGVKVFKTGLYSIYGKLTFVCTQADNMMKTVLMEIIVHEGGNRHNVLLRDSQEASCDMKSDLVTVYKSGLFRLEAGNVIHIRYKVPPNVELSTSPYQGYKSNMGVWRVGFA